MDPSQNNIIPLNGNTATNETNSFDDYKRKCKYVVAKFNSKIETRKFKILGDPNSKLVFDVIIKKPDCPNIRAEFTRNMLDENVDKVPSLSSTCTISLSKEENYEREFGYIQTSKMLFHESEFEKAILCSDFHANLMHGQDEVLDSDGENNPFYSKESYFKVPAGPIGSHSIVLKLFDRPRSVISKKCNNATNQTSSNIDWGCLVKHERHQQFFVYLVMRYKENNKWENKVLFSFDWFIYLKWVKSTDKIDIFKNNSGLNEHQEPYRSLPEWIKSEKFYQCNKDQFYYSVDKTNVQFNIVYYPESIYKHELEIIYDNINEIISNMKKDFENIKLNISNAKKLCENIEEIEDLEENIPHIESINLEGKKVSDNLFECIGNMDMIKSEEYPEIILRLRKTVKKICNYVKRNEREKDEFHEKYRNIAEGVKDLGKIEFRESISSKVNKLHNCIKVMNSIEDKFYKGIKCFISLIEKLCKEIERREKNKILEIFQSVMSELKKLYKFIENSDLEKIKFLENYQSVILELKKLYKFIENSDLKKIKFRTSHETINSQKKQLFDDIEIVDAGEQVYKDRDNLLLKINKLCESIKDLELEENEFIKHYRSIGDDELSTDNEINEFRENYVKDMRRHIKYLILNDCELFERIEILFPEIEALNENVEKLNLRKTDGFCKNFLYLDLKVKQFCACIEMMELKRAPYRYSCFTLDVEEILSKIEKMSFKDIKNDKGLRKIEELCLANSKYFEKSKFCECNKLKSTELHTKIKDGIIRRNKEESRNE